MKSKMCSSKFSLVLMYTLLSSSSTFSHTIKERVLSPELLQSTVDKAYVKFMDDKSGKNADYIPYLATVPSSLFAVVIATKDGEFFSAGDADYAFSIQSVAKLFTAALVMQESGADTLIEKIGVEPTGLPFNSITAVEQADDNLVNPMVNAGAIATVSLVKAKNSNEKWRKILQYYSDFAGERLTLNKVVYKSEAQTNARNKGIAHILYSHGTLYAPPLETTDVYTKQGSVNVTAKQLAMMGATLANQGVHPKTKKKLLDKEHIPKLLAAMMMAGFYDDSGTWAFEAGLPAKTGVGGGVIAIVPGEFAIVGFSPPLDEHGNSVRAAKAIKYISKTLNIGVFDSAD